MVNSNTSWRVEAGPGKQQREIAVKKRNFFLFLHDPEGDPIRVAAIVKRSISDVGEVKVRRTDSSQNLVWSRSFINVEWINEGGRKQ